MYTNVTSLVGDSGAVFTMETTRNSEQIDIIFKNFALKMEKRTSVKVLTKNFENTRWISKFLAWLKHMRELIFKMLKIFGWGYFLTIFCINHESKNDPSQKSCYNQKSVFLCPSTMRRNFLNSFIMRPYFHNCLSELWQRCVFPFLRQNS